MKILYDKQSQPFKAYSYTDLARAVDRTQATIWWHIENGNVPRPRIRNGKRWFYSHDEFEMIVGNYLENHA